jgi:hypothetical protein
MVMVGEWKANKGVISYTVTGTKDDVYKILAEVKEAGGKFADTPVVNQVHNGQWHMLLKLKIPVEVGVGDPCS